MSRPNPKAQKPKKLKSKEDKELDPITPTTTQVSLTKYITQMESPVPNTNTNKIDSKKRKKNSGENPPDKSHHISPEIKMNVNPLNTQHETVNTQNNPSQSKENC